MTDFSKTASVALSMLDVSTDCRIRVSKADLAVICERLDVDEGIVSMLFEAVALQYGEGNSNNARNPLVYHIGNEGVFFIDAELHRGYVGYCGGEVAAKERLEDVASGAIRNGADEACVTAEDGDVRIRISWELPRILPITVHDHAAR